MGRLINSLISYTFRTFGQALRLTARILLILLPRLARLIWFLLRAMLMSIFSLFVGVPKTIHSLAAGVTEQDTGYPYNQKMDTYNFNRIKATFLLILGWISLIAIGIGVYFVLTRVLN
jgi:hypothetical protein